MEAKYCAKQNFHSMEDVVRVSFSLVTIVTSSWDESILATCFVVCLTGWTE